MIALVSWANVRKVHSVSFIICLRHLLSVEIFTLFLVLFSIRIVMQNYQHGSVHFLPTSGYYPVHSFDMWHPEKMTAPQTRGSSYKIDT